MTLSRRSLLFGLRNALLASAAAVAAPLPGFGTAWAEDGSEGSHDGGSHDSGSGGSDDGGGGSGGGGSGGDSGGDSGDGGSDGGDGGGGSGGGGSGGGSGSSGGSKGGGSAPSQTRDGALASSLKGRIAPIDEIEAMAGETVPGEIVDIKLYRDRSTYVYGVRVMQKNGAVYDLKIDAVSRKLISARPR